MFIMTETDTAQSSQPLTARIDDVAPDFTARTTQGEVSLSDYLEGRDPPQWRDYRRHFHGRQPYLRHDP